MDNSFRYEIKEKLGVLSQHGDYTTEVNLISYNGADPKVDIRRWNRKEDKMLKGITLDMEEVHLLIDTLKAL